MFLFLFFLLGWFYFFQNVSSEWNINHLDEGVIDYPVFQLHPSFSCWLMFSCSVVSDSLWPRGLQHIRLPCPSPPPRVCSNSCPLSWWYYPVISSSIAPFSSCPQSFPFCWYRYFLKRRNRLEYTASVSVNSKMFAVILELFPYVPSLRLNFSYRIFPPDSWTNNGMTDSQNGFYIRDPRAASHMLFFNAVFNDLPPSIPDFCF